MVVIALACKRLNVFFIAKELGPNNKPFTGTYDKINNLSANDIIEKDIRYLKIKFSIDNIPIENNRLSNMC